VALVAESWGRYDLPGSAESQSGTKLAVEEELLKLMVLEAKVVHGEKRARC